MDNRFGRTVVRRLGVAGLLVLLVSCASTSRWDSRERSSELIKAGQAIVKDSEVAERSEQSLPYKLRFEVSGFDEPGMTASGKNRSCGRNRGC